MARTQPQLAVALDGTGWHPAAWREPDARPRDLLTAGYWIDLVREAEAGKLDFVTIADSLRLDREPGRLDAVLIASRVAPLTNRIGLVPAAIATHTEPFHLSKAIATLDYVSQGRAGLHVRTTSDVAEARHFGRRTDLTDLAGEAADYVEVLRRLWDSWADDAEIRDVATGRFVDRDKLHYIDFTGRWFTVKGPSITPRPPQGQPIVAADARIGGDLVFVEPHEEGDFADVVVFLDETTTAAVDRKARLDDLAEPPPGTVFTGTPEELADQLAAWDFRGFRLHPAAIPHDLTAIVRGLVPLLQGRGEFRREYETTTLRGHLGLSRPANRYEVA
ncbi:LLM class flavin-dependent oxidoreductase [Actinocrispum wychmicini]|nr:LLM class flavin-dependent oxidoreductase [Actinocrispum wychmicini]